MKPEPNITILDNPFDATDGADTPFGKRYGGDVFTLTSEQIQALMQGKTLALNVQNEYVVFLKAGDGIGKGVADE